jgi:hypothetical protein
MLHGGQAFCEQKFELPTRSQSPGGTRF